MSTISGITQLPGDMVQVSYNRVVPEMAEGSLDDPQIRQLLMVGTKCGGDESGACGLGSTACEMSAGLGHQCAAVIEADGKRRSATRLLVSLRSDKKPGACG